MQFGMYEQLYDRCEVAGLERWFPKPRGIVPVCVPDRISKEMNHFRVI